MTTLLTACILFAVLNSAFQVFDLHSTIDSIKKRGAVEMNERLSRLNDASLPIAERFWLLLTVKAGAILGIWLSVLAAWYLSSAISEWAIPALVIALGCQIYVAVKYWPIMKSNWKVWRGER